MKVKGLADKAADFLKQDPNEALKALKPDEKKKRLWLLILVTAVIVSVVDYFLLMVNGYGGPDTVTEGIYNYYGDVNALSLYRWALPYINDFLMRDLVAAHLIVPLYSLTIVVSVMLLCSMFRFDKGINVVLTTAAMVSFPVVTRQYAYIYMALAYAISFLMVVLAAYLFRKRKIWGLVIGTMALVIMMGCYQAYVAAAATIALVLFVMDMVDGRKIKSALADMGIYAACGIVAVLLNQLVAKWVAGWNEVIAVERVEGFSISEIFSCLKLTINYCYVWLFDYYKENILGRDKLYLILIVLVLAVTIYFMVIMIKERKIAGAVLLMAAICLMPVAINLCAIIFPHNGISSVMKYQYVMIIPLVFLFVDRLPKEAIVSNCVRWIVCLDVCVLIYGYSVTAVSTELGYKIAYDATRTKAELILNDVFETEGYEMGVTKVILSGAIDWSEAYLENQQIFLLGEVEAGPVFWGGSLGMTECRDKYFKNYLGVNLGSLTKEEYLEAMNSEKFASMPVWPQEGSVDWYNDTIIVKISDSPILY